MGRDPPVGSCRQRWVQTHPTQMKPRTGCLRSTGTTGEPPRDHRAPKSTLDEQKNITFCVSGLVRRRLIMLIARVRDVVPAKGLAKATNGRQPCGTPRAASRNLPIRRQASCGPNQSIPSIAPRAVARGFFCAQAAARSRLPFEENRFSRECGMHSSLLTGR